MRRGTSPPKAKRRRRAAKDDESGDDEKLGGQVQETLEAFIEDFVEDDDVESDPEESVEEVVDSRPVLSSGPRAVGIIQVLNVVVTAYLSIDTKPPYTPLRLQLMDLIRRGSRIGFQFNKRKFAALIVSCINPNCCVLIFEKGKVVCAGCSTLKDAKFAIDTIVERVRNVMCEERPLYRNLKAHGARARNFVGCTSFPHEIDIKRLQLEHPQAGANPIANAVKLTPPVRKPEVHMESSSSRRRKSSGAIHLHESGYMLIIGAANRREVVADFHYIMPIVRRYKRGSVDTTFSTSQMSAYYGALKEMYEGSKRSPDSFVIVRDDGTAGTAQEWHRHAKVDQNLAHLKHLIETPREALLQRQTLEQQQQQQQLLVVEDTKSDEPGNALVRATSTGGALTTTVAVTTNESRALINRTQHDNQIAAVRASSDATLYTVRAASAKQRVKDTMNRMRTAKQVALHGADSVAREQKPKGIKMLSMKEASQLYSGVHSGRV